MAVADFSVSGLVFAAGVDPWGLAGQVLDGRPERVRAVGDALVVLAAQAGEVARLGQVADAAAAAAYTNDGVSVYDVAAVRARSRAFLGADGGLFAAAGATWFGMADDLTLARQGVTVVLEGLTEDVNRVIAVRNEFVNGRGRNMPPEDGAAADQGYAAQAADLLVGAGRAVQVELDRYDGRLLGHAGALAALTGDEVAPGAAGPRLSPIAAGMGGPAPAQAPPPAVSGPSILEQMGGAVAGLGTVLGEAAVTGAEAVASVGNAIAHHPLEAAAVVGGGALAAISAFGVVGGGVLDATGVGAVVGVPLGGLSALGVATGVGIVGVAGASIMHDAMGPDRVDITTDGAEGGLPAEPELDRDRYWENAYGDVPTPAEINADDARAHIPWGDGDGVHGGHIHNSGVPGRSTFPDGWVTDDIIEAVEDVARNPDAPPVFRENKNEPGGVWIAHGTYEGLEIRVIVKPDGEVITGYPLSGPGVHRNDATGRSVPLNQPR